ncbi:hypothetical protein I79_004363 [Cricetulus griseus]|uniref:Uncharacterized protein n=1 Tax=Cricetulus griseus TaxID=10029 RepID=G3H2F3_CRIGR|nr:hypothetical protein I79_004363 [Cricetulus griseus]
MNLRISYVTGSLEHAQCPLFGLQMLFTIRRIQDSLKKDWLHVWYRGNISESRVYSYDKTSF